MPNRPDDLVVSVEPRNDGGESWFFDGPPDNHIVWSGPEQRVCFMAHSGGHDPEGDTARAALVAAAPVLRAAVEQAAIWFEKYAVDHYAKARNANSYAEQGAREYKAKRNQERADFMRAALAKANPHQEDTTHDTD